MGRKPSPSQKLLSQYMQYFSKMLLVATVPATTMICCLIYSYCLFFISQIPVASYSINVLRRELDTILMYACCTCMLIRHQPYITNVPQQTIIFCVTLAILFAESKKLEWLLLTSFQQNSCTERVNKLISFFIGTYTTYMAYYIEHINNL